MHVVVVTGGRYFSDENLVGNTLMKWRKEHGCFVLYHGGCSGADYLASCWALENGLMTKTFKADWKTHGKAAGPRRNDDMLNTALGSGHKVFLIAFPGGRGTASCKRLALKKYNIPVIEAENYLSING